MRDDHSRDAVKCATFTARYGGKTATEGGLFRVRESAVKKQLEELMELCAKQIADAVAEAIVRQQVREFANMPPRPLARRVIDVEGAG